MTTRKTETNGRLLNFIRKHKFNGLVQVYTKPQLVKLCQAYGVSEITRLNKPALAKRLSTVVLTNRGFSVPAAVDCRQYAVVRTEADPESGQVCIRLSSVAATRTSIADTGM